MDYIIAYNYEDGSGLSEEYPWIHEVPFPDIDIAKEHARDLVELGFTNVTLFGVPEDFYMEMIPWNFINEHKIDFK